MTFPYTAAQARAETAENTVRLFFPIIENKIRKAARESESNIKIPFHKNVPVAHRQSLRNALADAGYSARWEGFDLYISWS